MHVGAVPLKQAFIVINMSWTRRFSNVVPKSIRWKRKLVHGPLKWIVTDFAFCIFRSCLRKWSYMYEGHLSIHWTLTKAGKRWDRQSTFSGRGNNKNGITWSVFCKPQCRKNVITWPDFLNRGLKPTVREAGWKRKLVHGRLKWIV